MCRRHRLAVVAASVIVTLTAGLSAVAAAEVDPRLAPLLEQMKAFIANPKPMFMRQKIDIAVNGQSQPEQLQEIWMRDMDHLRMERSDGTTVVLAPDDIKMYIGPARLLLHIPRETLETLGDKRGEALRMLDLSLPRDQLDLLEEGWESMAITGEDTVGDEACWVLTVDEGFLPRLRALLGGIPEGFTLQMAQIALGRETGMSRALFFEFAGPAQLEIGVTIEEIEEDADVPDDMFTFEPPDDALILTWTPDKTPEQMRQKRDEAIAERMK